MPKESIYDERARLIDAKFLGELSAEGSARLAEIEAELDRRDAPKVAAARKRRAAEFEAIKQEQSDLKAKIKIDNNAPRRPQAKTATPR